MATIVTLYSDVAQRLQKLSWRFWIIFGYVLITLIFLACSAAFVYLPINQEVIDRQTTNLTSTAQAEAAVLSQADSADAFVHAAASGTDLTGRFL